MVCLIFYLSKENGIVLPYCSVRLATQYLFHIEFTRNYAWRSTTKKHSLMLHDIHFKIYSKLNVHFTVVDVASNSNLRRMFMFPASYSTALSLLSCNIQRKKFVFYARRIKFLINQLIIIKAVTLFSTPTLQSFSMKLWQQWNIGGPGFRVCWWPNLSLSYHADIGNGAFSEAQYNNRGFFHPRKMAVSQWISLLSALCLHQKIATHCASPLLLLLDYQYLVV